jgi:hypothetical protein
LYPITPAPTLELESPEHDPHTPAIRSDDPHTPACPFDWPWTPGAKLLVPSTPTVLLLSPQTAGGLNGGIPVAFVSVPFKAAIFQILAFDFGSLSRRLRAIPICDRNNSNISDKSGEEFVVDANRLTPKESSIGEPFRMNFTDEAKWGISDGENRLSRECSRAKAARFLVESYHFLHARNGAA